MTWWQISFDLPDEEIAETLAGLLAAHTGAAVEVRDSTTMLKAEPGTAQVVAGFGEPPPADLESVVTEWLETFGLPAVPVRTRRSEDESWREGWRAFFRGARVSDRIWVRPPWEAADPAADVTVVVDPGMAFGTGTHETTRGCLRMLEALLDPVPATPVLDVGCGSGILAIAAALFGAQAVGVDNDPDATDNAAHNVALNGVADRVRLVTGTVDDVPGRFDVIVANILAPVLIALAPELRARCGRDLVLAGLLTKDEDAVCAAYPDFEKARRLTDGDWCILHLRRAHG
jgi:ribosomal protein L11 methyltransferase